MKVLALGDPHGKLPKNIDSLIKKNKINLIICVGDVPPVPKNMNRGGLITFSKEFQKKAEKSYRDIVKKLCSYKIPVLILKGNMYTSQRGAKVTKSIFEKYKNLHYKKTGKIKIDGISFIMFDMIFEKHSHKYRYKRKLEANIKRGKRLNKLLKENKGSVLISHAPPFGHVDKIYSGRHVGSKILFNAIKKCQPSYCLCGHIHEARGQSKIGKTKIINLGSRGDFAILEF